MKLIQSILALIFGVFLTVSAWSAEVPTKNLDRIVAVVNNHVVTQSQFDEAFAKAKVELAASHNPQAINDEKLKDMVLQHLIDEQLQLDIAHRMKMTVSHVKVDQAILSIAKQNHLTLNELKEKLKQDGIAYATYRTDIQQQILVRQVQESAAAGKVQVTEQDLQDFMKKYQSQLQNQKQYRLIDVLIPLANQSTDAETKTAKEKADNIAVHWRAGEDPEKFAPNDTEDLGWRSENDLPALFLNQLKTIKKGDIIGPIQAPNGFHVIQLVDARDNTPNPDQLKQIVFQMKAQHVVEDWLKELRKTAYIKIVNE